MSLSTTVRARVDESVKQQAESILHEIGLNTSQAINIFLKRIIAEEGIPFELKTPSKRLKNAIKEANTNQGTFHNTLEDMMKDLKDEI